MCCNNSHRSLLLQLPSLEAPSSSHQPITAGEDAHSGAPSQPCQGGFPRPKAWPHHEKYCGHIEVGLSVPRERSLSLEHLVESDPCC